MRQPNAARSLAATFVVLVLGAGAREQCIPGPFRYVDNGEFFGDNETRGVPIDENCFDPNCPDFICTSDGECQNFFGPEGRCESGTCRVRQQCPLGQVGQFCQNADETCAFDPTSQNPFNDGVCRPVSSSPAAAGGACDTGVTDVNPCAGGAFCMPVEGSQGICVESCDNDGLCGGGFNCASPFFGGGGRALCMPACNLDAPDCGDARSVCTLAQGFGGGSCTPDNGACVLAGCDDNGCDALCAVGGADCGAGTFCIETVVDNCRIDGPDQAFAVCSPPAQQGQQCILTEPGSCANGLACLPFGFASATCGQQSASPAPDGAACDPGQPDVNRCEAGSYCAQLDIGGGVCQRFCDDEGDCATGFGCARANLTSFGPEPSALADVRVCAAECLGDADCPNGLDCDVDGALCTGPGFCVPPEDGGFCNNDADCASRAGTTRVGAILTRKLLNCSQLDSRKTDPVGAFYAMGRNIEAASI